MTRAKTTSTSLTIRGQACVLEREPAPEWLSAAARRKLHGFRIRCGNEVVGSIHGRTGKLRDVCGRDAKKDSQAVCARGLKLQTTIVRIGMVETKPGWTRAGVATRLYEALAKEACAHGRQLVSAERIRDSASHAFWAKQAQKGRVVELGANLYGPIYALRCDAASDLSGVTRKPRRKR